MGADTGEEDITTHLTLVGSIHPPRNFPAQYDKVISLDMDVIVRRNIDHLFGISTPAAAMDAKWAFLALKFAPKRRSNGYSWVYAEPGGLDSASRKVSLRERCSPLQRCVDGKSELRLFRRRFRAGPGAVQRLCQGGSLPVAASRACLSAALIAVAAAPALTATTPAARGSSPSTLVSSSSRRTEKSTRQRGPRPPAPR